MRSKRARRIAPSALVLTGPFAASIVGPNVGLVDAGVVGPSVPLRLCYRTTVFRHEPEHAGREREIFQVGAELIGVDDVAADGEILALMIECLKQLGLQSFKIALGHVGFFKALLARSGDLDASHRARKPPVP